MYNFVVAFFLSIDPLCIYTSSLQVYVKLINNKISNIYILFQSAILFNSHMFAWTFLIIECYQDEEGGSEWCLIKYSGEHP